MLAHFEGGKMSVQRGQVKSEHDQFGIQPNVFVNGKVPVFTNADLETAPLQEFGQSKHVHRIGVHQQDGRGDVRGGHDSKPPHSRT